MEFSENFWAFLLICTLIFAALIFIWPSTRKNPNHETFLISLMDGVAGRILMYKPDCIFSTEILSDCTTVLDRMPFMDAIGLLHKLHNGNHQEVIAEFSAHSRRAGIGFLAHCNAASALKEIEKIRLSHFSPTAMLLLAGAVYARTLKTHELAQTLRLLRFRLMTASQKALYRRLQSEACFFEGKISESLKKKLQASNLFFRQKQWIDLALLNLETSHLYFLTSNHDHAFLFCDEAFKIFNTCGFEPGIASCLYFKGLILNKTGHTEAAEYFNESLAYFEKLQNHMGQILSLQMLVQHHIDNEDLQTAHKLLNKASKLNRSLQNSNHEASLMGQRAYLSFCRNRLTDCLKYAEDALSLYQKLNDTANICNIKHLKAKALHAQNQHDEADKLCRQILNEMPDYEISFDRGEIYWLRGNIVFKKKQYEKALRLYKTALKEDEKLHNLIGMTASYLKLAETSRKLKRKKDAQHYQAMADQLLEKSQNKN